MTYETYPGSLYDYNAGTLCGVLVKEGVMRKLAKLQAAHLAAVKQLLTNEAERGNVFPSMWTIHYPAGEQTMVHFVYKGEDLNRRIQSATVANPPRHHPLVFVASSMDEAKQMADERHAEMHIAETAL